MIVVNDTDFIGIACAAHKIAESAHTAYWLKHVEHSSGRPGELAPGYLTQEANVLEGFREIALQLGFRIERISPASLEAAE